MKRLIYGLLVVGALGMLCFLAACKPPPAYLLEEDMIIDALEETGLPGTISESDTISSGDGHIQYLVRSPTETYSDTVSPEEAHADPSVREIIASIISSNYEGEHVLNLMFHQRDASDQIVWEEWKQQILFAALLYGGFEDEEEVYRAFLGKERSYHQTNPFETYENPSVWDAQLTGGYCRVSYSTHSYLTYDENNFQTRRNSASLRVNLYESQELFERLAGPPPQSAP